MRAGSFVDQTTMVRAAAVGAGYAVIAYLCLTFTRFGAPVELVWLPNALLVAVLTRVPRTAWPTTIVCAAIGHVSAHVLTGDTIAFSAAFLAGDMVEALLCAVLLVARPQSLDFLNRAGVFYFLFACAFSALVSASIAWLAAWPSHRTLAAEDLYVWFGADSLALIIFVPIFRGFRQGRWSKLREQPWHLSAAVASVILVSVIGAVLVHVPALRLVLLPLFVVIAFDLGVAGVEICLAVLLLCWYLLTVAGYPATPWIELDTRSYLIVLQFFIAIFTATVLPLAVVLEQKQRLNQTLSDCLRETREAWGSLIGAEARYRLVVDNVSETVMRIAPNGVILFASPACAVLMHMEKIAGRNLFELLHPDDEPVVRERLCQCMELGLNHLSHRWPWRIRDHDAWIPIDARVTLVAPGGLGHEEFIVVASPAAA